MIDYQKLKIAHELCNESFDYHFTALFWCGSSIKLYLFENDNLLLTTSNLDDLITKLKELTQPKPKYDIGQTVFWIFNGKSIESAKITALPTEDIDYYMILKNDYHSAWKEDKLFASKEELIQLQIDYWLTMKEFNSTIVPNDTELVGECDHESDGIRYTHVKLHYYKCIKCGEFY